MRQVQQIMGMPISIDVPGCDTAQTFNWAFARFRQIDKKFSTYKYDSEVSRYRHGEIMEEDLSKELKMIIRACHRAEEHTDGYFSAWYNGTFDPSGYVKGWSIAEAAKIIEQTGYKTYCIGAGGDILASSKSNKIWNIGIQNPSDSTKALNTLSISSGAVATSGNYVRGDHIFNPKTKQPAHELLSVTVTGPNIIMADILATALFAAGVSDSAIIKKHKQYQAMVLTKD
jgi:thiamine biosynthesis lipoprotein